MDRPTTVLIRHADEVLTLTGPPSPRHRSFDPEPLGLIKDGAVAISFGTITHVGTTREVEGAVSISPDTKVIEARGCVLTPGLIDPHTHALFVGDRASEFSMRVEGVGYKDIAARGGGIANSVKALREASDDALAKALSARLFRMLSFGVTTVEVKTGYALDTPHELRCLRIISALCPWAVPTSLSLHAVAPELRSRPDGRETFLRAVREETLPAVLAAGNARFIDAYIDSTGFSVAECEPTLTDAARAGLGLRLHVGQFDDIGGAELAARLGAASADHLEHVSDGGLGAMADAGVVGVLLPGAAFSLGQRLPDARRMRALGLSLALGTDANPGTSNTENLPLMAAFAVRQMGLSTVEAWEAITRNAAKALLRDDIGALAPGMRADLCVMTLASWEALPYRFGSPLARTVVQAGVIVWESVRECESERILKTR